MHALICLILYFCSALEITRDMFVNVRTHAHVARYYFCAFCLSLRRATLGVYLALSEVYSCYSTTALHTNAVVLPAAFQYVTFLLLEDTRYVAFEREGRVRVVRSRLRFLSAHMALFTSEICKCLCDLPGVFILFSRFVADYSLAQTS